MKPVDAALQGAREVGFTVLSMSISLIAVFIPILLMGGIVGRLFREFAVTLSVAILVSLVVSLTTTPMMCAHLLRDRERRDAAAASQRVATRDGGFDRHVLRASSAERACDRRGDARLRSARSTWALAVAPLMIVILSRRSRLNVYLYSIVPKGFFPQQDTGRMGGAIVRPTRRSRSRRCRRSSTRFVEGRDGRSGGRQRRSAFTGGGQRNSGNMFVALKPLSRAQGVDRRR